MAASASASCSIDDLAGNEASGGASAPEEDSQIEEDISEAVTEDEGYSDEDFAEATVDADKSRADHSQSISQSVDQIQSASHSKSLPSSPPSLPLHPPSTSVRPLVGIGSPPKPERHLSEAASAAPSAAAPSRPENDDLQSEQDESYSEDFAEGTLGSSKRAGTAKESLAESLQSYSDDFAEGSATAGKSQSGTFEMSEALSSASRSGGRQRAAEEELQRVAAEAEHRKAEALQRESEEEARRQAEDERLKAEAEMRARVEERRRQIAETQQKAAQVVHVSTAARPTPAEGDGRAVSDAAVSEDLEEIEEDEDLSMHLQ
jgi:colicin import membrane protein